MNVVERRRETNKRTLSLIIDWFKTNKTLTADGFKFLQRMADKQIEKEALLKRGVNKK